MTKDSGEELWNKCNEVITSGKFKAKDIIKMSNVETLCTTDDPADSIEYHDIIKEDTSFKCKVLPAFRPDNAMNIEKENYLEYIARLEKASGKKIDSFNALIDALKSRIAFFNEKGCRLADHGLWCIPFSDVNEEKANEIFVKRINGDIPNPLECDIFAKAFLVSLHEEYAKLNWVSQLHYGCRRDNNTEMFKKLGPNTGFDAISRIACEDALAGFLDCLNSRNALGKIIVYSLNPNANEAIDTICACFQDGKCVNKIQHGSAWWFNDNKLGMENHLKSLATNGNLAGFGSGNPITDEDYTDNQTVSYRGHASAVLRSGYDKGKTSLTISAPGMEDKTIILE